MFKHHTGIFGGSTGRDCKARNVQRATLRPVAPILLGLLVVQALTGCGGSGPNAGSAATATPLTELPPTATFISGRYVGTVTIDGADYFGDALLTVDGAIRLYVGGPYSDSGALQLTKAKGSAQLVGSMDLLSGLSSGTGLLIGQGCSDPVLPRFCAKPAPTEIALSTEAGLMSGEIRVTTDGEVESWRLQLHPWDNYYELPAGTGYVAGQYQEVLAEFAPDNDVVIMTVDGAGRVFFQSAASACTGNGMLAPHLDGRFNVYDMTLTIEGCSGSYEYLNGAYEGLSTTSPSGAWDYDVSLRSWLPKRAGDPSPPAALILWGSSL
jgi:hypothetical protein